MIFVPFPLLSAKLFFRSFFVALPREFPSLLVGLLVFSCFINQYHRLKDFIIVIICLFVFKSNKNCFKLRVSVFVVVVGKKRNNFVSKERVTRDTGSLWVINGSQFHGCRV